MPTATPFNNLITFSRGSNATVTGSNGLIQWAPNNLLLQSESFDAAVWAKGLITMTANSSEAPDGTITADRIVSAGGAFPQISQAATLLAGQAYTFSIWVRSDGTAQIQQTILLEGQLTNFTPTSTWQRISVTVPSSAGGSRSAVIATNNGSAPASSFLVWGAQLELGSTATNYNPTTVKNLLGFSEAFNDTAWTKVAASIVTGAQANPVNGLFNAQKFMEDTTNAQHIVRVNIALPTITNTPYGYAVYAKAAGRTQIRLTDNNVSGATFTLTGAGATSNLSSGVTAAINQLADGWYRCFITVAAATVNGRLALNLVSSDNITYTGDGNSGVYIYGAQLSDSASLDPYVPTPGAAPSSTAFYGPRFDYDPVTLQPRGLLVEEQRTNLLLRSEEFNNLSWNKARSSIAANATTSPDGTINADKLVENTDVSTSHGMNQVFTGTAASHTFAIYVKAGERSQIRMKLFNGTVFVNETYFDLATGTVGAGTGGTITNAGNGWYRCSITGTLAAASCQAQVFLAVGGSENYTGDGVSGAFLYGAQVEAGAFATSYIPTVASTVTRSADVATISGSLFSQWYRQDEGAIAVEIQKLSPSATAAFAYEFVGATSNFSMRTRLGTDARMQSVDNGVAQVDTQLAASVPTTASKYAVAFRLNDYAGSANGATVATDTSGTVPAIATISIGSASVTNLYIRNIRFIPARAADFQLQGLST